MKNIAVLLVLAFGISASAFAQVSEKPAPAKQPEKKEISEANQLRRTLEQNQLNLKPERLNNSTATNKASKKKRACKKKNR